MTQPATPVPTPRPITQLERLWDAGQNYLVQGRYGAAARALASADALAWRRRDPATLARIALPLLEARRQIRQLACEGQILITAPTASPSNHTLFENFLTTPTGTCLLSGPTALARARTIQSTARRTGASLEALILLHPKNQTHLASPAALATTLPVTLTTSPTAVIHPTDPRHLTIPLPPPGLYPPAHPLHPLITESLFIAWEALALKWQFTHPLHLPPTTPQTKTKNENPWQELAWLRAALKIDPACEPIFMRFIALTTHLSLA